MENEQFEDVFPIEDGDFPASHVSLPECNLLCFHTKNNGKNLREISFQQKTFLVIKFWFSSWKGVTFAVKKVNYRLHPGKNPLVL